MRRSVCRTAAATVSTMLDARGLYCADRTSTYCDKPGTSFTRAAIRWARGERLGQGSARVRQSGIDRIAQSIGSHGTEQRPASGSDTLHRRDRGRDLVSSQAEMRVGESRRLDRGSAPLDDMAMHSADPGRVGTTPRDASLGLRIGDLSIDVGELELACLDVGRDDRHRVRVGTPESKVTADGLAQVPRALELLGQFRPKAFQVG